MPDAHALDLFRDAPAPGPHSHRGALPASAEAAVRIEPSVSATQWAVLDALAKAPCTADEIAERLSTHFMRIRPRVAELFAVGLVEPTGEMRPSALGNPQHVYRLSVHGARRMRG